MSVIGTKNGYGLLTAYPGIQPELRKQLLLRDKALSGDMVLSPSITTFTETATTATGTWTKTIRVELQTNSGDLHDWFCGWMTCALVDSATTGVFSISGGLATTVYFNGGVTNIILTSTTGPFNAATTCSIRLWRATGPGGNPITTISVVGTFA